MPIEQDVEYHTERAREELDRALRAEPGAVADAHWRLSVLHKERLQQLDSREVPPLPIEGEALALGKARREP